MQYRDGELVEYLLKGCPATARAHCGYDQGIFCLAIDVEVNGLTETFIRPFNSPVFNCDGEELHL